MLSDRSTFITVPIQLPTRQDHPLAVTGKMKFTLDIPEELHNMISNVDLASSRLAWSFQAGPEYTALKLTWKKDKTKKKAQKDRTLKRRGGEITHPPTRDIAPGPSSAVPDVPETTPALARPRKKSQTSCRYRRNQKRYWEWRKRVTRKGPLQAISETSPNPPTGSACGTDGESDCWPSDWPADWIGPPPPTPPVIHTPPSPAVGIATPPPATPTKKRKASTPITALLEGHELFTVQDQLVYVLDIHLPNRDRQTYSFHPIPSNRLKLITQSRLATMCPDPPDSFSVISDWHQILHPTGQHLDNYRLMISLLPQ